MKKLIYQTALFAYVNTICFRNLKPTCTKISEQFNRNIIYDSEKSPYGSHDKLQGLLLLEGKWNKYLQKRYGHLIKSVKSRTRKSFLIIDDTVVPNLIAKNLIFSLGFIQAAISNISMVSMLFLLSGPW